MAPGILEHAHRLGLVAHGISFHVGSQQNDVKAWDKALASAAAIFNEMSERGLHACPWSISAAASPRAT